MRYQAALHPVSNESQIWKSWKCQISKFPDFQISKSPYRRFAAFFAGAFAAAFGAEPFPRAAAARFATGASSANSSSPATGRPASIAESSRSDFRTERIRSRASLVNKSSSARPVGRRRPLLVLQPPPRTRERQAFDEQQVLDLQHPLDIGLAIDAGPALHLRDAEILELRLPRAQHVRLHLRELAHLRLPKQRPIRDLNGVWGHRGICSSQVTANCQYIKQLV